MEIIRNFIKIIGLVDEAELPKSINGQIMQYSENDTIYIPQAAPDVQSIFQIMLSLEVNPGRTIKTPFGTVVILDGAKHLKIMYSSKEETNKAHLLELDLPFNTFIELPESLVVEGTNEYILDAYFKVLDGRRIYSNIVYLVCTKLNMNLAPERPDQIA